MPTRLSSPRRRDSAQLSAGPGWQTPGSRQPGWGASAGPPLERNLADCSESMGGFRETQAALISAPPNKIKSVALPVYSPSVPHSVLFPLYIQRVCVGHK